MNQLMTKTYPSTFENDSNSNLLDLSKLDSSSELNIRTASIEDLSKLIVTEMISSVKEDIKVIISKDNTPKGKK